MSNEESKDVEWIVPHGVEGWVGERVNDCQDWRGGVAETWRPEDGDRPVRAVCDGGVQILGELMALCPVNRKIRWEYWQKLTE